MSLQGSPNPRPTTSPPAPRAGDVALSLQEREILSYVLEGHSNAVIAEHLAISETAAKGRLKRLLRKINVDNRVQATIWALTNLPEFRDGLGSV